MTENSGHYMVPVNIGGKDYPMMVDTGAVKTALTPAAADMMGLDVDGRRAQRVAGIGGEAWSEYARIVPSLKLGPSEWINLKVLTADMLPAKLRAMQPPPVGLLGADVLSRYDVEFDFPAKQMTLYTAQNCFGWFVPWQGRYHEYFPDSAKQHLFLLAVVLNGHPIHAMLDTGASRSLVTKRAALNANVDEQALNQFPAAFGTGFGGTAVTTHRGRFNSLQIGPLVYRDARLDIGEMELATGDMLLGMDFMRTRRVWVSYSNNRVFMQPADFGAAQPTIPAWPPGTPMQRSTGPTVSTDAEENLRDLLDHRPDLSTHTHITYSPSIQVRQGTRLQLPPLH
ncbi:retroviral-like aspartic protease family protein [Paraburkholderia ribeironis]|nr:retroviral-like aspartic protease family protein [Paraburkholderia ribeironis]